jgi:hypothetical protein
MMKKSTMMILTGVLFAAGAVLQSSAQVPASINAHVPGTMNYQGRLVGPTGTPYVDGTYTFDIRLYMVANGGTPLWGGTYSSYVKDGYFNIMLGATGGQALAGTTYTHTDLWKALWPDPVNGATGDPLYLGVTPWQNASGVPIDPASRTELSPRQTLLTAPYAFRAQTAEYANKAGGDFSADGRITTGNITTTGNLLNTVGTTVNVGGADGNTTLNAVNINALGIDINAGTSDLWMSSADRIDIDATGLIDIVGQSSTYLDTKNTLDLKSSSGTAYLQGNTGVQIKSSTGTILLDPATSVVGRDLLLWNVPGGSASVNPLGLYRIAVYFTTGYTYAEYQTNFDYDEFSIMIVGLENVNSTIEDFYVFKNSSTGTWKIRLTRNLTNTGGDTVYVQILIITKNWVNDQR